MKHIAVLSAGNGGQALAADLTLRGHSVRLFELPEFAANIDAIRANNNEIVLENKLSGRARIACLTTSMEEAVEKADIIYFTAPSYGQAAFFSLLVPAVKSGQCIVLLPGNYGTFALKKALAAAGKQVYVAEADNLPYACVATEPGRVNVRGIKKSVMLASYPASDFSAVESLLQQTFCTGWRKGDHVLATSMASANMVVHCAPMLANAARIESEKGKFEFYYAGMTPSVCRLIEATDRERLAVAAAYGLHLTSTAQTFREQYGVSGIHLYDVLQANPAFAGFAPSSLMHRFLTEDTPYSMVPMTALGCLAHVPTPVMDSLIVLLSELVGEDYKATGQNLERMGLAGMSIEAVLHMLAVQEEA